MAVYHFTELIVWDNLAGSVRFAAGVKSLTLVDPLTGLTPTLTQGGVTVGYVTADSLGRVTFTATVDTVRADFGAGAQLLYSDERLTATSDAAPALAAAATAQAGVDEITTGVLGALLIDPAKVASSSRVMDWVTGRAYIVGELVVSGGTMYRCTTAHTSSGGFDSSKFTGLSGGVSLPDAAEQIQYLTVRGSDANDGRSLKSAKATIAAALTALAGSPGTVQLGAGTITTAATHTLATGQRICGAGRNLTTIGYTGTGTLFQGVSGTRTYNQAITNLTLAGPGKATTSVAVDLVDVSQATMFDFLVFTFGVGVKHRSAVLGGAVYNDFGEGFFTSCGIGVDFGSVGSNGSRWHGIKFGSCTTGVNILDSNQNNFHACQFEANTTGIKIDATAGGTSDHNSFTYCRFEGNTTDWTILGPLVRDTQIIYPATFGTYTYTDLGARTAHVTSGAYGSSVKSSTADAAGAWRFERTINAGASTPAMVVSDSVTTSGTPITLQVETGRPAGVFFRGVQAGSTNAEITALGQARFTSLGVGNAAAATTPGTVVKKLEVFDQAGVSLGFVPIYSTIT